MSVVSSLSSILGSRDDKRVSSLSMLELGSNGNPIVSTRRSFQYFPETITDSRGVNWNEKNVVGGSHPIYQWTNGSARTIGFEVIFSREAAPPVPNSGGLQSVAQSVENIGAQVSSLTKNPVGTAISLLKNAGSNPYDVDVAAAIAWLRAKTYPLYQKNLATPPPKLLLVAPNSGIVSQVNSKFVDSVPVIMTSCTVTYESFFRTGHPRVATVALEFSEIVQIGTNNWGFVSRDVIDTLWQKGYTVNNLQFENSGMVNTSTTNPGNLAGASLNSLTSNIPSLA